MNLDHQTHKLIGQKVADVLSQGPDQETCQIQERTLVHYLNATRGVKQRRLRWLPWVAVFATSGVLIFVLLVLWPVSDTLPFWVGHELRSGQVGEWLLAQEDRPLPIRFPNDSRIRFSSGSKGRVLQSQKNRVLVELTHGSLHAHIQHPGPRYWRVEAGPYSMIDRGTVFFVDWNHAKQRLVVEVSEGAVQVKGPSLDKSGVLVSARNRLVVDALFPKVVLDSIGEQEPEPKDPGRSKMEQVPTRRHRLWLQRRQKQRESTRAAQAEKYAKRIQSDYGRAGHAVGSSYRGRDWKRLYDQGRYDQAIAAAQLQGFDSLLSRLSLVDLWQLAESSRYAARGDLAKKALMAVRKRFPDSKQADVACFLLGRVAMELNDSPTEAVAWFRKYLKSASQGLLAEEALGRLIRVSVRAGQAELARQEAKRYLDLYPDGLYASMARSVLERGFRKK